MSAKDLQKSLERANISVDESTIRKTLNKNGVHGVHGSLQKCNWMFHSVSGKILCGQMKLKLSGPVWPFGCIFVV